MSQVHDRLHEMNDEYRALTGSDAYLYASVPGSTERYSFATHHHTLSAHHAMTHMIEVLELAKRGRTHDEIIYGSVRTD
jgi:hypothetical protein